MLCLRAKTRTHKFDSTAQLVKAKTKNCYKCHPSKWFSVLTKNVCTYVELHFININIVCLYMYTHTVMYTDGRLGVNIECRKEKLSPLYAIYFGCEYSKCLCRPKEKKRPDPEKAEEAEKEGGGREVRACGTSVDDVDITICRSMLNCYY